MKAKHIVTLLAMIAVLVLAVGCGEKKEEKSAETSPIILGVPGAHSGDLAAYGLPTVNAAQLVVEELNSKGGVLGREVVVSAQDDQCKPEFATNAATKLVSEGANVVLGHICSGATKAAMPIYTESQIVCMSPSATNPPLTQSGDYPNFFRTIASDDMQARVEVDFVLNQLGKKTIAIIHDKGDYGKGFATFCQQFLIESGNAEVVLFEGVTPGAVDYGAVVQKVKNSGADAVIFGGYHPEASKIVSQMRKKGVDIPFLSEDGVKAETFIKVAGEYAEGVYATGPRDISGNPLYKVAYDAHMKKYGTEPGNFFFEAYAAAQALLNAVEKAGSTDYNKIVKVLRTEFVETPLGKIRFDEKGDAEGVGFSVYQVQNGKFVEVK
ncbi:MAG: branched-chain amino acid ABC transporter substrate-binding protein [Desulfovibrio sp.]